MPECLTWEQFVPPHTLNVVVNEPFAIDYVRRTIDPIGEGVPFCERYRLHTGRYSTDEKTDSDFVKRHGIALVATYNGEKVGLISGMLFWVHAEHRRSVVDVDIAAELSLAHALLYSEGRGFSYLRKNALITMTQKAINANKRAYHLAVQRGIIVPPAGYPMP